MTDLQVGDKVTNPKTPDWGMGKVVEVAANGKVKVFFINAGEKLLSTKYVALEKVEDNGAKHRILDNPTFLTRAAQGKNHVGLPEARDFFLKLYPNRGFEDENYIQEERAYKIAARELFLELLGKQEFLSLLAAENFDEIVKRALQVINKTNLIFPNEKMGLKDGLKSSEHIRMFSERLFNLLYGEGEFKGHFELFADCLERLNASKWTTMTYFLFLAFPEKHMFLKPEVTKHATELTKAELNYKPELNWLTYSCLLDFADYLKQELVVMGLPPRDMIDVQSFMWCITPGKYDLVKDGKVTFTKDQYRKALRALDKEGRFDGTKYTELLVAQYNSEDHVITATLLADSAGYENYNAANLQYGTLAKHLAGHLGYLPPKRANGERMWWRTLSDGNDASDENINGHFEFVMHAELAAALEEMQWVKPQG